MLNRDKPHTKIYNILDQATISWHAKSNKDYVLNYFQREGRLFVNLGN
jgi:hypothetical protein